MRERGVWAKFTPPARDAASHDEMWRRLAAGQIDLVSTDHAPATKEEKSQGEANQWEAPFGIPGVETTLPMMLNGVSEGKCTLETLVRAMSERPAQLYGLYPRKGALAVGSDADMVIVDLSAERTLSNEDVRAKVGWTPYAGRTIRGLPLTTISRGRVVFDRGELVGTPDWGRYLARPGSAGVII